MSAAGAMRPCGGDAHWGTPEHPSCDDCAHYELGPPDEDGNDDGRCVGDYGWTLFGPVALEVAGERAEMLRLTAVAMRQNGVKALAGLEPVVVQDDWGWEG